MARPKSGTLTGAELRVMEVLWSRGSATVAEIQEALHKKRHELAYTTILTTLQTLETKGFVGHEASGRAYVYRPLAARQHSRRKAVQELLRRWFDGSPNALVLSLLEEEDLSDDDREELRKLLRKKK
jgi:predicted transcriptional regulator